MPGSRSKKTSDGNRFLTVEVQVDEAEAKRIYKDKINEMLKEADADLVFWDAAELRRRTCMSWTFIQEQIFFDLRFPKRKIGVKWYFLARAAREFLEAWLMERL